MSNDISNLLSRTVTILPLTTSVEKVQPYEVLLRSGVCGNPPDCKVMAQQIKTVDKIRLGDLMGMIPDFLMTKIDAAMRIHLNLDQ